MADALVVVREAMGELSKTEANGLAETLRSATYKGLQLQERTLDMVLELIDRDGENVNPKLLRLGNETATALLRSALRAAEGEFQQRKAGALDQLLEEIRVAKAERGLPRE
jgi:hypothetical protein